MTVVAFESTVRSVAENHLSFFKSKKGPELKHSGFAPLTSYGRDIRHLDSIANKTDFELTLQSNSRIISTGCCQSCSNHAAS